MKKKLLILFGIGIFLFTGCSNNIENNTNQNSSISSTLQENTSENNFTVEYSSFDVDFTMDNAKTINLDELDNLEITEDGNYILTGTLNGSVVVNTTGKVKLMLQNANITGENPINIENADKVMILLEGTNTLTDTRTPAEDASGAAISSSCPLTFYGSGTLFINTEYNNGISSDKNIKFINCDSININAKNTAVKADTYMTIDSSTILTNSEGDGFKTTDEDADKGYIYINESILNISTLQDGINAANQCYIYNSDLTIETNGTITVSNKKESFGRNMDFNNEDMKLRFFERMEIEGIEEFIDFLKENNLTSNIPENPSEISTYLESLLNEGKIDSKYESVIENIKNSSENFTENFKNGNGQRPMGENMENFPKDENFQKPMEENFNMEDKNMTANDTDDTTNEDISSKGIKALYIDIANSSLNINSSDHCIYSKGDLNTENSTFTLASSYSKGIKALSCITINSGTFDIDTKDESIEGKEGITINDGSFNVVSEDDCINSAGIITINSGTLNVYSKNNDAIDSNFKEDGAITINGGSIVAIGSRAPEAGLDTDNSKIIINGGNVIAFGGSNSEISETSTQNTLQFTNTNTFVNVSINNENIFEFENENIQNLNCIISLPEFNTESEIDINETSYTLTNTFTNFAQNQSFGKRP